MRCLNRIPAAVFLAAGLRLAAGQALLIDGFETPAGWHTGGQKEIRFDLSRRHVSQGRKALHLHVEIDHENAEQVGKVKYPMGWPSVKKQYPRPLDLSGYDFIEFDVYFKSRRGIDPDFGLNVTFKDRSRKKTIYSAVLIDLRNGKWAHEKLCIRGVPAARAFGWVSFWLSESSYDDGAVIDFYIDNLRATRADHYTPPTVRPVRRPLVKTGTALLWFEGSCRKVGRTEAPRFDTPPSPVVEMAAARNETEAVQLVLRPLVPNGVGAVRLEVGDLAGPGGATIPPQNITWSPVEYVPAREGPPEGLPDALPGPKPFQATRLQQYPIWLEVYVPRGTPAGEYAAPVTVHTDRGGLRVKLQLHVWDFTVPVKQHLRTSTTIYGPWGWRKDIRHWYGDMSYNQFINHWRPKIVKLLARSRLSPSALHYLPLKYDEKQRRVVLGDTKEFERFVTLYMSWGCRMDMMPVPYFFNRKAFLGAKKGTPAYLERITEAYRTAADYLEKRGWLDDCYVYCADEVVVHKYTRPIDLNLLNRVFAAIHAAHPKIRIFGAETPSPILHGMNIWCININAFDLDVLREQHRLGHEVWWYNGYRDPRPGMRIAARGIDHRILGWMNWKYGIDGYLIWTVNRWLNNPWKAPNPSRRAPAGDHFLLYPNPDGTVSRSIRLAMLRDGLEDYEYHWVLADLAKRLRAAGKPAAAARCRHALAQADSFLLAYDDCAYLEPAFIYRSRRALASAIQQAKRALGPER